MPINDEPIKIRLDQLESDLDEDISLDLKQMTVAGALSLIPGIGSAIQSLLDGKAQRNVQRRWIQLFQDMKEGIDGVRSSIPDDTYYSSEEFQTLLAQAYQQLLTTHDREKLRLLAKALVNSGTAEFKASDEKELFIQTLRDLSAKDMKTLLDDKLKGWTPLAKNIKYQHEVLISLQRLQSLGLIVDNPTSDVNSSNTDRVLLQRRFGLSAYGIRFLKFIEQEQHQTISTEPK